MKKNTKARRVAFLLNANAKSVTKALRSRLLKIIPKEQLYISHDLKEAENHVRQILNEHYTYVFCGGGDGTVMSTINLVYKLCKGYRAHERPRIGVLRLGTGNALARMLNAHNPIEDVVAILKGKPLKSVLVDMIETHTGHLTPFAGVGFDAELVNDFEGVKDIFFESPFRRLFSSFLGFSIAGIFNTLPKYISKNMPTIDIKTESDAYKIVNNGKKDEEISIQQGTIFSEKASIVCVGTVKSLGYGLTMFPFAQKRPGYLHLRVSAVPISTIITHVYPSIWHGNFRHKKLYDFLVKDITIESNQVLPYQIAGDPMGYKKKIKFKTAKIPVAMATLKDGGKLRIGNDPLLIPLA